jgi:hypothetical protein
LSKPAALLASVSVTNVTMGQCVNMVPPLSTTNI